MVFSTAYLPTSYGCYILSQLILQLVHQLHKALQTLPRIYFRCALAKSGFTYLQGRTLISSIYTKGLRKRNAKNIWNMRNESSVLSRHYNSVKWGNIISNNTALVFLFFFLITFLENINGSHILEIPCHWIAWVYFLKVSFFSSELKQTQKTYTYFIISISGKSAK